MFVDEAEIYLRGGNGGPGCLAFTRERYRPKGGPCGGNGGVGGTVYAEATAGVETLLDFAGKHHWIAENGRPGESKQRAGRSGKDVIVQLPAGTLIYDRDSGVLLKDLSEIGERVCLAAGGVGGRGNKSYATPTHQTPEEFEPGEPGEERHVRLELKLIADIGFVGLPNAGKSTLLSVLSRATPKIAAYPFTTLQPQLGIAELSGFRRMVLADIPGLIEGAHEGSGLGDAFLRHIERTRIIVHILDIKPADGDPKPAEAFSVVCGELAKFSKSLAEKPTLVVANKIDLDYDGAAQATLRQELGQDVLGISAAARTGLDKLTELMWQMVTIEKSDAAESPTPDRNVPHLSTGP